MAIRMADIRRAVLEAFGLQYKKGNYHKLPADFGTHPAIVRVGDLQVKVLTSADARATSKTKATRPHRILIWDDQCKRWIFAGKYVQHCDIVHRGIKPRNQNKGWR